MAAVCGCHAAFQIKCKAAVREGLSRLSFSCFVCHLKRTFNNPDVSFNEQGFRTWLAQREPLPGHEQTFAPRSPIYDRLNKTWIIHPVPKLTDGLHLFYYPSTLFQNFVSCMPLLL